LKRVTVARVVCMNEEDTYA